MPKPFDATTKQLLESHPQDWLRYAGLSGTGAEVMDADLATITTDADRVLRITEPRPYLAHFELQSSRDDTLVPRTLRYNVLLDYRHGLAVRSVLVLLRPEAESPGMTGTLDRVDADGISYLTFAYTVIRLWEQPVETVLAAGLGTLPLAPLSKTTRAGLPEVIRQMEERIAAEATTSEARLLWAATYVLMGLRYSAPFAAQILKGVQQMRESTTYQAILEEGKAEGQEAGARATILRLGTKRYGEPSAQIVQALQNLRGFERLELLAERLLEAENWDELMRYTQP